MNALFSTERKNNTDITSNSVVRLVKRIGY